MQPIDVPPPPHLILLHTFDMIFYQPKLMFSLSFFPPAYKSMTFHYWCYKYRDNICDTGALGGFWVGGEKVVTLSANLKLDKHFFKHQILVKS